MAPSATNGTNGTASSDNALDWTTYKNVIGGEFKKSASTRCSINPATGEDNDQVPVASKEDVDAAMDAAEKAFKPWANTPWADRSKALLDFADGLEAEKEGFVKLLTKEQGKPRLFAESELQSALHWTRSIAVLKLDEEVLEQDDKEIIVRYTPLGVAVGIVPWNFPILLAIGKIAPAVLTGNPIIIKPSPFTPAGGIKLVELAQRYFPPGVVQVLSGDDSLGPMLTAHPVPKKISFTGSSFTGKKVMESCSKTLKRVTLELGGKDPAIICEDVNIQEVAPKIATMAFLNSGQICIAMKRIFIHEKIYEPFRDAMAAFTKTLKMGEGNEEGVFLGPINNKMQYDKVKTFFTDVEKEKYNVAVGGENPSGPGYFITPTIIDRPEPTSRIMKEEPFGPIVPLMTFSTDEEAIKLANDTVYGLGASVWSGNIKRANAMARQIEAGNVWVNSHLELDPRVPFGGHKESGIGTEFGIPGLKSYCNSQTLYLKKAE